MSFIKKLFSSPKPKTPPPVVTPDVTSEVSASSTTKLKRGARLALFATQGGSFGVTGSTPTARRKLLGN